jgi:hypothetical protein
VTNLNKWIFALGALMIVVFGYSFWIGAQKPPSEGGPSVTSD